MRPKNWRLSLRLRVFAYIDFISMSRLYQSILSYQIGWESCEAALHILGKRGNSRVFKAGLISIGSGLSCGWESSSWFLGKWFLFREKLVHTGRDLLGCEFSSVKLCLVSTEVMDGSECWWRGTAAFSHGFYVGFHWKAFCRDEKIVLLAVNIQDCKAGLWCGVTMLFYCDGRSFQGLSTPVHSPRISAKAKDMSLAFLLIKRGNFLSVVTSYLAR